MQVARKVFYNSKRLALAFILSITFFLVYSALASFANSEELVRRFRNSTSSSSHSWRQSTLFDKYSAYSYAYGPSKYAKKNDSSETITVARRPTKEVGIVISACNDSLSWLLDAGLSCRRCDIFIYERCLRSRTHLMSLVPATLKDCISFVSLGNVSAYTGKSHHAYLTHIISNWDNLHLITAFLKDSPRHSSSKVASLHAGISFQNLAVDKPLVGRRGRATFGLTSLKIAYAAEKIPSLTLGSNLTKEYVSFRSVFAASAEQIRKNHKQKYIEILNFTMSTYSPAGCDALCISDCLNCELLERTWAKILGCGNKFTAFHKLHDEEHRIWNTVHPRTCMKQGAPLLLIDASEDPRYRLCAKKDAVDVARSIYLAGILQWDVLLQTAVRTTCDGKEKYDGLFFEEQLLKFMDLRVFKAVPEGYKIYDASQTMCSHTSSETDCPHFDDVVENLAVRLEKPYAVRAPLFHEKIWQEKNRVEGVLFIQSFFKKSAISYLPPTSASK